jgi:CheY-like chemotaxis protein
LVELHGGTIEAENVKGGGARFTVTLPVVGARHDVPLAPRKRGHRSAEHRDAADLSRLRVLAVDDEPDARALVARILSDAGADVVLADSADAALAYLAQAPFDLMVVDVAMPGKSGLDLAAAVRRHHDERTRTMPLVALTAHAGSANRERILEAGFTIHAGKPITPSELVAIVSSVAPRRSPTA